MPRTRVARFRLKVRLGDLDAFQKGYSSHAKLLRKYYGTGLSGKKKKKKEQCALAGLVRGGFAAFLMHGDDSLPL